MALTTACSFGITIYSSKVRVSTCASRVASAQRCFLSGGFAFLFRVLARWALLAVPPLLVIFVVIAIALPTPIVAAQKIALSVDVSKAGAKIDRNIFGQFAEHLGDGIYDGIWVGPDSTIPNTRGIHND